MVNKRGTNEQLENICPVCGLPPRGVARTLTMNSFCGNGHEWHLEKFTRQTIDTGEVLETWFEWTEDK